MAFLCAQARQIGCPPRPMRSPLPGHLLPMWPPPTAGRLCVLPPQIRSYNALMSSPSSSGKEAFSPVATQAARYPLSADLLRSIEAVLVCIYVGGSGELRVILTDRSSNPSSHSGEVWLPGGNWEDQDQGKGMAAAALREANEEIGVDPASIHVIWTLTSFTSENPRTKIAPVIGILSNRDSFTPVLNKDEVDGIFDAPLKMFLKAEYHQEVEHLEGAILSNKDPFTPLLTEDEFWDIFETRVHTFGMLYDSRRLVEPLEGAHYFHYETQNKKFLIWGLTAGILIEAAAFVYDVLFRKYYVLPYI